MKRMAKYALTLTAMAALLASAALPAAADYDVRDVNRDGQVSMADAIYLNRYLMGNFSLSDPSVLDANQNLIIDHADSQCIQAYLIDLTYACTFL